MQDTLFGRGTFSWGLLAVGILSLNVLLKFTSAIGYFLHGGDNVHTVLCLQKYIFPDPSLPVAAFKDEMSS